MSGIPVQGLVVLLVIVAAGCLGRPAYFVPSGG